MYEICALSVHLQYTGRARPCISLLTNFVTDYSFICYMITSLSFCVASNVHFLL